MDATSASPAVLGRTPDARVLAAFYLLASGSSPLRSMLVPVSFLALPGGEENLAQALRRSSSKVMSARQYCVRARYRGVPNPSLNLRGAMPIEIGMVEGATQGAYP
jgi:hypothetical protein